MKKIYLKFVMVLLITIYCIQNNAQTVALKGGLNLAGMFDEDNNYVYSKYYSYNFGYHLGLTVDVPIYEFISFDTGVLLTTRGYNYFDDFSRNDLEVRLKLHYLEIPLALKLSL